MTQVMLPFEDRRQAGRVLAEKLAHYRGDAKLLVLALPRGGVAVGFEVARALHAPLDIFVVRKLGFPGHEEYAMGAIASGGIRVMTPQPGLTVSPDEVAKVVAREQAELLRREQLYRNQRPAVSLAGRTVIVVDDGLATGATMRAAVLAIRQQTTTSPPSCEARSWSSRGARSVTTAPTSAASRIAKSPTVSARVVPGTAARTCATRPAAPTKWSAPQCRSRFALSACGMRNSPRPATTRCARCWKRRAASIPCRHLQKPWRSKQRQSPKPKTLCWQACGGTCSR